MGSCDGMIMIWLSTVVRIGRMSLSREVLAMVVHRVVQSFRARWRFIYLFSIWSRKLIISMIHEFRLASIFRFPACWSSDLPSKTAVIGDILHSEFPTNRCGRGGM